MELRVVTYNLLSPALWSNRWEDPALTNNSRFLEIKSKLNSEIFKSSVICLQEVSRTWAELLLPFLESKGYGNNFAQLNRKPHLICHFFRCDT